MFTFIEVLNLCRKSMRQSEVMKADLQKSDNVQAPGSFSNDKWNPGDIWMSTYGTTDYVLTNRYETWSELNQQVLEKAK